MPRVRRIALHYNNVYVVEGAGVLILIDTGPDYEGAWEAIQEELRGRVPTLVVATHAHLDHAGLGRRWQESGAPVVVHSADHHLTIAPQLDSPRQFDAMADYARECGADQEVVASAIAGLQERRGWALAAATNDDYPAAGRNARWPTALRYPTFIPEHDETTATSILKSAGLRMHHAPGHTPGNVVLSASEDGWLFSGDQLLPAITPTPAIQFTDNGSGPIRFHSLPEFVDSMEGIDASGLTFCYPGHGEPFEDVHGAIERTLTGIRERTERVVEALRTGGPRTVFGMCESLYPRAANRRFWQVIATVQGNLDLAEAWEMAVFEEDRYRAAD